ncbi:MAG: baseplate assembly protein [Rhodospirillaceae bacterium]
MSRFATIDLSKVTPPEIVESLDANSIASDITDAFVTAYPDFSAVLQSDPVVKLINVVAKREVLLRARVNDAAKAVLLAFASGPDLENVAALLATERALVDPGDPDAVPPVDPTYEDDDRLRARAQLAMEALSVAGPEGAYTYHAVSADGRVLDVALAAPTFARWDPTPAALAELPSGAIVLTVADAKGLTDPMPGDVAVTVLSSEGDGQPDTAMLEAVGAALNSDEIRPISDTPRIRSGTKQDYSVSAKLDVYSGPDPEVVRAAADAAVTAFVADQRKLGEPVTFDGLHAALRVAGVRKVTLSEPSAEIEPMAWGYAHCTSIAVTLAGGD